MNFSDVIKKSVMEGFAYHDMPTTKIVVTLCVTFALAAYMHLVYKMVTKNAFYNKSFGVSMVVVSMITAGIVMAMQSSLVISLGMVGALSIVRFRTAIKDPLDLMFLFWSISAGIICGAGLYELATLTSVAATFGILIFCHMPVGRSSFLLVINGDKSCFEEVMRLVKSETSYCGIKSKNLTRDGLELILEVKAKKQKYDFVDQLVDVHGVEGVNLLENDVR